MLEGILDKRDEQQGRQGAVGQRAGQVEGDGDLVRVAQLHQGDVGADKLHLLAEGHAFPVALVEHIAHHLRQLDDGLLCLLGVDIHQGVDIVEGVHEEMGIDLIAQILQLLLQVLVLELGQSLAVLATAKIALDAQVGTKHQQ